tara:strand:+ start:239 stop:532 length:294 start_codon:yes stop_codon:yes gene_type:complete
MKYTLPELSYVTTNGDLIRNHSVGYPHELHPQYSTAWVHAYDTLKKFEVIELRENDYSDKRSFRRAEKERSKILQSLEVAERYLFAHCVHFENKDNE